MQSLRWKATKWTLRWDCFLSCCFPGSTNFFTSLYHRAPHQTAENKMLPPHGCCFRPLSLSLSLYSLTSLSTYCRQAGSFATNSVTSLAQQIANQPFGAKQWPRPEPPLPVHQGSGTNGWEPSEARSTHSARVTEWRKPPSTESGAARRAERRADEEDQVQLKTYRALLGLCCWSSVRKLIREVVNILFQLVRLSQWLYWTSGLRLICSHSSSRQ